MKLKFLEFCGNCKHKHEGVCECDRDPDNLTPTRYDPIQRPSTEAPLKKEEPEHTVFPITEEYFDNLSLRFFDYDGTEKENLRPVGEYLMAYVKKELIKEGKMIVAESKEKPFACIWYDGDECRHYEGHGRRCDELDDCSDYEEPLTPETFVCTRCGEHKYLVDGDHVCYTCNKEKESE